MKIYSQLFSAQLENRTSDYSSGTRGRIWMRTDTSPVVVKFDDGSALRTLVTTDNSQTLTNKTLTSPVVTGLTGSISVGTDIDLGAAANTSRLTFPSGTLAAITALSRKEGTVWYATDTDKLYKDDGTSLTEIGTGAGGAINYIGNPDAESAVTGWATYADAAGTSPVNGTGGSATVTITRTTSTPLRGTGSFLITKDAANRQGEGVSYDFTINTADQAKVLNISFDYNIASGTFVSGDSSDLRVWIYDVTNSALIPVAPYTIQGGGTSNYHKFTGTFQTASNSTSYRLIIHVATTSASAYTFKFDSVVVGPQTQLYGAPIGDWTAYTPTAGSGFGTVSNMSGFYRRVGDSLHVAVYFVTGTVAASLATLTLPSGIVIDSAKIPVANTSGNAGSAVGSYGSTSSGDTGLVVTATGTSTTLVYFGAPQGSTANLAPANGDAIGANTAAFSCYFVIPVAGWSSTVQMSNDTDTRVVAARISGNAASAADGAPLIFPTAGYDTHGAYNASTGLYTAPVSGVYIIGGVIQSSTSTRNLFVAVDGSAESKIGVTDSNGEATIYGSVKVNAGQTISIEPNGGALDIEADSYATIHRLSGPSAIAASEKIVALAESNTNRSISNNSATSGEFLMEDIIINSHGAYSASTAIFTCPRAGTYRVTAHSRSTSGGGNWDAGDVWINQLFKSTGGGAASLERVIGHYTSTSGTAHTQNVSANGTCLVSCLAGDTLEVRILQTNGGSLNTDGNPDHNWVSYESI